jgi:hypothetical protein
MNKHRFQPAKLHPKGNQMGAEQNLKNHRRNDPFIHYFVFPVFLLNLAFSIWLAVRHWPAHEHLLIWWVILSIAFLILAVKCRMNDLKLQDRIIRLEERLRLKALLGPDERPHISELSTRQLIALRFASDEELPTLVRKTLTQNLESQDIKQSIANWRADTHRV